MTKVVGIDFGTTNVRIAQWDTDAGGTPASCQIGTVSEYTMPAVIAFERLQGGKVNYRIGEEADALGDDIDGIEVVRNIKRFALMSDDSVRRQDEWDVMRQGKFWPTWFDQDTRSIRLWNETLSAEEAIRMIIKEAISRSGLEGQAAEWRAGCPVGSDLTYRRALVSALSDLGCTGKIEWISQEPLLLLALGRAIGSLVNGYYLVYDMDGGSFDCTAVEVQDNRLIVLAEEGLSALGGMDIDDRLKERLEFTGNPQELRVAKEQLSSDSAPQPLEGGFELTRKDIDEVLDDLELMDQTVATMVTAFKKALILRENWENGASTLRVGVQV